MVAWPNDWTVVLMATQLLARGSHQSQVAGHTNMPYKRTREEWQWKRDLKDSCVYILTICKLYLKRKTFKKCLLWLATVLLFCFLNDCCTYLWGKKRFLAENTWSKLYFLLLFFLLLTCANFIHLAQDYECFIKNNKSMGDLKSEFAKGT